jgi:hypothetical protein
MIALLGASGIYLAAMQAGINAPTEAFRACLREASSKANKEKVAAANIDAYLRNACTVQLGSLKSAVVAFRVKNGMGRKAASADADMTVDDYVATSVDKYQFMADRNAPKAASTQQPTPAAAPQPPKQ